MRNRAKCRLCNEILESLTSNDRLECGCKQISIWGGQELYMSAAKDYSNFIRVDDDGQEHSVMVQTPEVPNISMLMKTLDMEIEGLEGASYQGMGSAYIMQWDMLRVLILQREILRKIIGFLEMKPSSEDPELSQ